MAEDSEIVGLETFFLIRDWLTLASATDHDFVTGMALASTKLRLIPGLWGCFCWHHIVWELQPTWTLPFSSRPGAKPNGQNTPPSPRPRF